MWLFLRWSGVRGGEPGAEEGARVGELDTDDVSGNAEGSNSRSGMGGEASGRRVVRRISNRSIALHKEFSDNTYDTLAITYLILSSRTTNRHFALGLTFRRRLISTKSWVNLMTSSIRAVHL
jgi:hypothetical protein